MIRLLRYLKPFTVPLAAVVILVFLQTISELYLPTLMSDIVDNGIVNGDIPYIWRIGSLMLLVAAVGMICSVAVSYLASKTSTGFGKMLRSRFFSRVESFSLNEFDRFGTATLITRTTNDINQLQMLVFMIQRMMLSAPIMCIGGIIMAVSQDPPLSTVFVVVIPVLVAVVGLIMSRAIPLFQLMQAKIDRLNLVTREGLTGVRVIRAFDRIERERERFDEANLDLTDNAIKVNKLMATLMPIMALVMNFTIIGIIWFGSIRIDNGNMQIGSLMAFIQYSMLIMMSLVMVSMMFIMIPRASASAVRINEVLDTVPEIKDPEVKAKVGVGRGYLEFRDVTFSFPGAEKPAISSISFTARPGETTAIIGGTGSGKTALISLIPRFYDIDSGSILINGVDITQMTQADLRARIGLVPQHSVLFNGSITDNIRMGKVDATLEEIRRAAETAQAMEFISEMKEGFDSVMEQGGTNVSGGQKQRLSIARALVRRPEIYVFDDSFSALDFKTDARLRRALKSETARSTVLIVAQRVATIMNADQIIVLDGGQMVGLGTHRELLRSCEVYREIVYSQLSEEEIG